jgi:hypothetical protein
MTHRESKKATKPQNKKHSRPEIITYDEVEKTLPKGVIKGSE